MQEKSMITRTTSLIRYDSMCRGESQWGTGKVRMSNALTIIPEELPSIRNARLPEMYQSAKKALAECSRIDECADWANKAEALASYARQADDVSLRKT